MASSLLEVLKDHSGEFKKFTTRPYPNLALPCRHGWCAHKVIGYKYPPGLGNSPHSLSIKCAKKINPDCNADQSLTGKISS